MPRKPIGTVAMTAGERQQRWRLRKRQEREARETKFWAELRDRAWGGGTVQDERVVSLLSHRRTR